MPDSTNSAPSLRFDWLAYCVALALTIAIGLYAAEWVFHHGYTLYYGDAEAHLNIARRIFDSKTPGPEQIGTVWLPLPHLAMLPFVRIDAAWKSGLAGAIPSRFCFILAAMFLFAAARRAYSSIAAAFAVLLIFSLNPNLLYLQATPMTEAMFAAGITALAWAIVRFRDSQSIWPILAAGVASNVASLTRYEGWFLIPFAALLMLFVAKRKWHAMLFGAIATLGPIAWLVHNQYYYSNALEFYNGPWSAMAIYARQLANGMQRYPGDHDWAAAIKYYFTASMLVVGLPALAIGAMGMVAALIKTRRALLPLAILALPPIFYIWSMHSSGTPIFIPTLWPFSYYNTRYAIVMLPLAAFAAGAIVAVVPPKSRAATAFILLAIPASIWAIKREPAVCWKESEVNSVARRDWTHQAATFFAANYRPGSGILCPFGDLTGILREAGIPLRETIHEGNEGDWILSTSRPYLALRSEWAISFAGDTVATAVQRAERFGKHYELRRQIIVKGAPVVEIYQLE